MIIINYSESEFQTSKDLDFLVENGILPIISEEISRGVSDTFPLLHNLPEPQKPYLIKYAEILLKNDAINISKFADIIRKKMSYYDKLSEDMFELNDRVEVQNEVNKIHEEQKLRPKKEEQYEKTKKQKQLEHLHEEIEVLKQIAKLVVRHFEKWLSPELSQINSDVFDMQQQYYEEKKRLVSEIEFWKDLYFKESADLLMIGKIAVRWSEEMIEVKEKLERYQTYFITHHKTNQQ